MRRRTRGSYSSYATRKPRKVWKILLIILVILILAAGWGAWKVFTPYRPDATANTAMAAGTDHVKVEEKEHWIDFEPAKTEGTGVILYPGALVKPESYAPLARQLAEQGHHTVIIRLKLNLAVLSPDLANEVIQAYPQESFVIGGHSLGGVMAARYAAAHPAQVKGVFFMASYADSKGSLNDKKLPVLSMLGSDDGVIHMEDYQNGRAFLPSDTLYYTIEGGNHAQFGSYGSQKGDHAAHVTPAEQLDQTVSTLLGWLKDHVDFTTKTD